MNESSKSSINVPRHNEMINGEEISTEIFRLQKLIQEINVDYERKRQTLEDDCNEQIKALEESTQKTRQLHDDLLESSIVLIIFCSMSNFVFFIFQIIKNY